MNLLKFLRKYQKFFFVIITTIIIISFSFFGSYSTFDRDNSSHKDETVGTLVTGKPLKRSLVSKLSLFLASDGDELSFSRGNLPNFLNDGVFKNDFLKTGLALALAKEYMEPLKNDLETRFVRAKNFVPYTHPLVPAISSYNVWKELRPQIIEDLKKLSVQKESNQEFFSLLLELYKDELSFPGEVLKRLLVFQQQQYDVRLDQELIYSNCALFGFEGVEGWFGKNFVDLMAQFILNTAALAEEKGYKISNEEALSALQTNLQKNLKRQKNNPLFKEKRDYFTYELRLLGLNKTTAVELWKKVLLFRLYMQDNGVVIDHLAAKQFLNYAGEKQKINLYSVDESLKLNSDYDLLALDFYLRGISNYPKGGFLKMPTSYLNVTEVEQKVPELVRREYLVKVKEVKLEDLALQVGEKELWKWQNEDKNWKTLQKEFATSLGKIKGKRGFEALEKLNFAEREKIAHFSRMAMVKGRQDLVIDALKSAKATEYNLYLSSKGGNIPFEGINDSQKLATLLAQSANEALQLYTEDNVHFFAIELLKQGDKEIALFEKVHNDPLLKELVETSLHKEWQKLVQQNPNVFDKPFADVRERVIRVFLRGLFSSIEKEAEQMGHKLAWKKEEVPFEYYAQKRFWALLKDHREKLSQNDTALSSGDRMQDQWKVISKEEEITHGYAEKWIKEEAFGKADTWSQVNINNDGNIAFFEKLPKEAQNNGELLNTISKEKEQMALEARLQLAKNILKNIAEKKAIVLPLLREQNEPDDSVPTAVPEIEE